VLRAHFFSAACVTSAVEIDLIHSSMYPSEIICVRPLHGGLNQLNVRIFCTIVSLDRFIITVRLWYATIQFLTSVRPCDDVVYGSDNHFWTPHAKWQLENFILAVRVMSANVIPAWRFEVDCKVLGRHLRRLRLDYVERAGRTIDAPSY